MADCCSNNNWHHEYGYLNISGGTINAHGTDCNGIGLANCGQIIVNISGGVVNALGEGNGIGIGARIYYDYRFSIWYKYGWPAQVNISGGVVTANTIGYQETDWHTSNVTKGVYITDGSVKVTGDRSGFITDPSKPKDREERQLYLLKVPNPNGETVKINGEVWNGKNHAALDGDTYLYAWIPEGTATYQVGDDEPVTLEFDSGKADGEPFHLPGTVSYYDYTQGKMVERTDVWTLGESAVTLRDGWFYVAEDLTIKGTLYVHGDVNLILADGVTLHMEHMDTSNNAGGSINCDGNLTVWSQNPDPDQEGTLLATPNYNWSTPGISLEGWGSFTLNGGHIQSYNGKVGIGCPSGGGHVSVTVNRGYVEVSGFYGGISSTEGGTTMDVTINGGCVRSDATNFQGVGIGGANSGVNMTINGGTVFAMNANGNGMGSRNWANVTINGGTVTAVGRGGYDSAVRVGGGKFEINGGSVRVVNLNMVEGYPLFDHQPVTKDGLEAYLFTVDNPEGKDVVFNGEKWSPVNHTAMNGWIGKEEVNDTLYAWLPAAPLTYSFDGGETQELVPDSGNKVFTKAINASYYDWRDGETHEKEDALEVAHDFAGLGTGWYVAGAQTTAGNLTVSEDAT